MRKESSYGDKAGKKYWDANLTASDLPGLIDIHSTKPIDLYYHRFHDYFHQIFNNRDTKKMKLLEIGCAKSVWLPYFATEFGFEIWGLDYSIEGCKLEKRILEKAGVHGEVICVDFFSAPKEMHNFFDVVLSFGVIEHFEDTIACIQALAKFLKTKGLLFSSIPNIVGLIGWFQKILNEPIYEIHVPLDLQIFCEAHRKAGLDVLECTYFLSTNFGIINLNGLKQDGFQWYLKNLLRKILAGSSISIWVIEERVGRFRTTKFLSPYIHCLSQKI